jgi:hypothetical protein
MVEIMKCTCDSSISFNVAKEEKSFIFGYPHSDWGVTRQKIFLSSFG